MKYCIHNGPIAVYSKRGNLKGVTLGYDVCAEHESGTGGLLAALGTAVPPQHIGYRTGPRMSVFEHYQQLNPTPTTLFERVKKVVDPDPVMPPMGIDRRRIPSSAQVRLVETDDGAVFLLNTGDDNFGYQNRLVETYREYLTDAQPSVSGWDDGFILATKDKKFSKALRTLHEAIQNGNTALYKFPDTSGPAIVIVSAMDTAVLTEMHDSDLTRFRCDKEFHETGVKDELRAAGKQWCALSRYHHPEDDSGPAIVWLNPHNQQQYNAGWFTVEELRLWAVDKGPVVKTAQQKKRSGHWY